MDMEMLQFHPTGMIYPEGVRGLLVTEAVRGEGGILTNAKGSGSWRGTTRSGRSSRRGTSSRRAIYTEIVQGRGTANGAVYLDITHRGGRVHQEEAAQHVLPVPRVRRGRHHQGEDGGRAHRSTTRWAVSGSNPRPGATRVVGLYAAGEVACGLHGANRLGGNSLGRHPRLRQEGRPRRRRVRQGERSRERCRSRTSRRRRSRILSPFAVRAGRNPFALKEKIAARCGSTSGSSGTQAQLEQGLAEILAIGEEAKKVEAVGPRAYNQSWFDIAPGLEHGPRLRGHHPVGDGAGRRAGGRTPGRTFPRRTTRTGS